MFNDLDNLFKFDKTNIHLAGKVAAKAYFEADDFTISSKDPSKQMKYITKLMNLTFQISVKFGSANNLVNSINLLTSSFNMDLGTI